MSVATMALALPAWLLACAEDAGWAAAYRVVTGDAFVDRPFIKGGALDQPSLQKEVFLLSAALVVVCPFIAAARLLVRREPRRIRLLFAIPSLILLLHPSCILTVLTYDIARYASQMGLTPMRAGGLIGAGILWLTLAAMATWIVMPLREEGD